MRSLPSTRSGTPSGSSDLPRRYDVRVPAPAHPRYPPLDRWGVPVASLCAAGGVWLWGGSLSEDPTRTLGATAFGAAITLIGLVLAAQSIILAAAASSDRIRAMFEARPDSADGAAHLARAVEMWLAIVSVCGIGLLVGPDQWRHALCALLALAGVFVAARLARLSSYSRALMRIAMFRPKPQPDIDPYDGAEFDVE